MKRIIRILTITAFLATAPLLLLAQAPPHPNGGNAPNTGGKTNTPVGGGAPIDGGLSILLVLGAAYGAKKVFMVKREEE
jgi:hypothetical protein